MHLVKNTLKTQRAKQVDELRSGLDLATDDELDAMAQLLFQPKFNPLDYLYTPQPVDISKHSRSEQIRLLEQRFRYLAADGFTVLRSQTQQVSYRQALLQVCRYLKMRRYETLPTADLESEVFLVLLEKTWQRLPEREQRQMQQQVHSSIVSAEEFAQLPETLQNNPMALLAKGGSAIALSAMVRPWLLKQIAQQFALHWARYQVAKQALVKGGLTAAAQVQSRVTVQMASRGMVATSARYGAMRGLLACLGPALWTWFLADLGWRAVATNYSRVIPVVFTIAQIRLTRSAFDHASLTYSPA
ncbi:MAG: YaaW family protein [Phormidesmis sp.]